MDDEKIVALLMACKPLANRIMAEGPNLPLTSLTTEDRRVLEGFEAVRGQGFPAERIEQLGRQAGLGVDVMAAMERLYNRIRTQGDPSTDAHLIDAYNRLDQQQ
jgi:hypothetical protein